MTKLIFIPILFLLGTIVFFQGEIIPNNDKWCKYIIDVNLKTPAIDSSKWTYPWYMIKHQDGHFENTLGESIMSSDTAHLIHNSRCILQTEIHYSNDRINSDLKFAKAILVNDTLQIKIYDESASNWNHVTINVVKRKFNLNYKANYVFPYKRIDYQIEKKSLILNSKPPFKKGEIIKGSVEIELQETIVKETGNLSKNKIIFGTFETKVE